jgi:hypothetical protein
MPQPTGQQIAGIEFESLRSYPYCVALTAAHPFARLKSIALARHRIVHSDRSWQTPALPAT